MFLLGVACQESDDVGLAEGQSYQAFATGLVTDRFGEPLSGVKIYVDNTIFYNSGISTSTDANGKYKVATPLGSWKVYAEMERSYHGITYKIELDPDNDDSFPGSEGAVRNFTWQLTGEKPFNPGSYYGGLVKLYKDPNSDLYDMQHIEFTFTPTGTLVDGSDGEVLIRSCGMPSTDFYSLIHDVPIGQYKITAKYLPTGQQLKLRNDYIIGQAYEFDPVIDFFGKSSGANTSNSIYLAFTDQ